VPNNILQSFGSIIGKSIEPKSVDEPLTAIDIDNRIPNFSGGFDRFMRLIVF
jgi:hypothetical protein